MTNVPTLPESDGWAALAEDWQSSRPATIDVAALRHRLDTGHQWMVFGVIISVLISLLYIIGPAYLLVRHPGPETRFLAIDSWAAVAGVWVLAAWAWRGTWKPLGETTELFLMLERSRALGRLRAARAALLFVIVQLVSVVIWSRLRPGEPQPAGPRILLLMPAAIVAAVIVMAIRAHRRVPRMVAEVDRLLAELRRTDGPA